LIKQVQQLSGRQKFFLGFLFCSGLMAYALFAQFFLNLEPCPLCIFQRVAVISMGIIFLACSLLEPKSSLSKIISSTLFVIAGSFGVAVASRHVWLQNLPSDQVPGCGPGLDFMMSTFPINEVFEMVFNGSGECATIDWSFLSLSMPAWVIICSLFLIAYAIWINYGPE
jgi:disulfide bond formation protein DsbB